jgi:uncharacterized protein
VARLLLWILLAALAYGAVKGWSRAGVGPLRGRPREKPSEPMVRCAACGLNVPQSEALGRGGAWYCSREHLERAQPGG